MIDIYATPQSTSEIRTHFVDFTPDLPAAVSISSVSVTLTGYPIGGTATLSTGVIADGIVPVVVTTPTLVGTYTVSILATLSSGDKAEGHLIVPVSWAAVRGTMADLIQSLREMTDTTANDYKVGAASYWSDKHLQDALDGHATYLDFEEMEEFAERSGETYAYLKFFTRRSNWENTPTILDGTAGTIATGYTFDARNGIVTFTASQGGSARLISGKVYDLNAAAADVWNKKAAHYAAAYDFSTDNHSMKRSQLVQQAREMAKFYQGQTEPHSWELYRSDCNG